MITPTKYKSISTKELKTRPTTPLTSEEKVKVDTILSKLVNLIKKKHT